MIYRCPKTRHQVSQEICASRKVAKRHGCATCTFPRQVANDDKIIERLRVKLDANPRPKHMPIVIDGLLSTPIRMSKRVAKDLLAKLQGAVGI